MTDDLANAAAAVAADARSAAARVQDRVAPLRPRTVTCRCAGTGVVFGQDAAGKADARPCRCARTPGCPTCEGLGVVHERRDMYTFAPDCPRCVVPQKRARMWREAGFADRHANAWIDRWDPADAGDGPRVTLIEPDNPLHVDVAGWADAWRPGGPGLFVTGDPGVGKSYAIVAGVRRLLLRAKRPPRIRYVNVKVLLKQLKRAMGRGEPTSALIDPLEAAALLVLDEVGVGRLTEYRVETISTLVDDRYEAGRTTCFITNHDPERLATTLDRVDAVAGARLVDRMREMSAYIHARGPSRRAWASMPGATEPAEE